MLVTRILGLFVALALVVPAVADEKPAQKDNDNTSAAVQNNKTKKMKEQRVAASRVVGASIYGTNQDETIGSVNDIVMTKDGKVAYLIAGSGGIAGVGETEHAVPVSAFDMKWMKDGDDKTLKLSLPMSSEDLANAPALSLDHASDLTVDSFSERNSKYFKATDATKVTAENMYLYSDLDGLDLKGSGNESVGAIEDVVFNHKKDCTAEYFILGSGGTLGVGEKYTPIPVKKVTITKTEDSQYTAMIDANKTIVGAAPKVTSDHYYAQLQNAKMRDDVDKAFAEAGNTDK